MAHSGFGYGGGAESHARFNQYDYKSNSSLVLTTDSRLRDVHESSTGEPETLRGKIDPKQFGDRVYRGKPIDLQQKIQKSKKKKRLDDDDYYYSRDSKRRHQGKSVLDFTEEEDGVYKPKTKETRAAYEELLSCIQNHLGGQPQEVLYDAADEVLGVLKNERVMNLDKKREIEKLLSAITDTTFDYLVSRGNFITDYYQGEGAATDEAVDGEIGVAVEFDEDEEEEESDDDQVQEENDSEEEDDDGSETKRARAMQMCRIDNDEMQDVNESTTLNVQDIDAYWLQRKISHAYEEIDPHHCQKLAEDVLQILDEADDIDVENKLVLLLDFKRFELIKFLLQNQLKIVWCTRLARAIDQEDRQKIQKEMMGLGPDLASILQQLYAARATAKERLRNAEKNIRQEASRLKDDSSGRIY